MFSYVSIIHYFWSQLIFTYSRRRQKRRRRRSGYRLRSTWRRWRGGAPAPSPHAPTATSPRCAPWPSSTRCPSCSSSPPSRSLVRPRPRPVSHTNRSEPKLLAGPEHVGVAGSVLLQLPLRAPDGRTLGLQPRVLEPRLPAAGRVVPDPGAPASRSSQTPPSARGTYCAE